MSSNPTPDPAVMRAIERLDYRATAGDVAAQAGLDVNLAQRGLLVLASEVGGHLQVAESGDMVFQFPEDFRTVLRNKYWRLRLKEWWEKVWRVLFYLIRISFGIVLIVLIALAIVAILAITIAASSSRDDNDSSSSDGGMIGMPSFWFSPDFFWIFSPNYYDDRSYQRRVRKGAPNQMNFLESVFSFLFGDGNPNADLEERRWQAIATVIRNNQGAVIAEQIAPYLDDLGQGFDQEYEQYMIPVLARFGGRPEVSPEGQIVYHFPDLQTTVAQSRRRSIADSLRESLVRFSQASSGQIMLATGLGAGLLVLALSLSYLVFGGVAIAGTALTFARAIAWVSLGYSAAYLGIPLIRYFWIQERNRKISARNEERQRRALRLQEGDAVLQHKLAYAQQFAAETVIEDKDLVYSTDRDLIEQEIDRAPQIDAEWQQRLEQGRKDEE